MGTWGPSYSLPTTDDLGTHLMHGLNRAVARKAETGIHEVSKSKGFGVHATGIQLKFMIPEMWSSLPGNWGLKRTLWVER